MNASPTPVDGEAKRFTRAAFYALVWRQPLKRVAEDLGLSANGVAKICDRMLIPYPPRGYWTKPADARPALRPALPEAPEAEQTIVLSKDRSVSRRVRTRRSLDARREQMLDAAGGIAVQEGVAAVAIRSVARRIGISETQGHNYFATRIDLLVALAQRELAAVEAVRVREVARGADVTTRVVLSTLSYFREAEARGPLLQELVAIPEVRERLRGERRQRREQSAASNISSIMRRSGMNHSMASASNQIMIAVCLRAGRLLAERRISRAAADRLCLPMVIASVRSTDTLGHNGS